MGEEEGRWVVMLAGTHAFEAVVEVNDHAVEGHALRCWTHQN